MIMEWLQKISGRERGMLALALAAVLATVANFVVVQPTVVLLRDTDERIEARTMDRDISLAKLEDEPLIHEEFRAASALLARSAGTSDEIIENLKAKVGEIAGQTGVALDSISHREPIPVGSCEEYLIEVSRFRARMPDLLRFLHGVSTVEGMCRVSKLSIKPRPKTEMVEGAITVSKVALADGQARTKTSTP